MCGVFPCPTKQQSVRNGRRSVPVKRVVVAPHPEIFGLYCLFAAKQQRIGADAPIVVRSMQSALDFLGLRLSQFAPVELPPDPA